MANRLKEKYRALRSKKHYEHDAYIDTLDYDSDNQRFVMFRKTVKMADIKPSDLAVTNDKYHYFTSKIPPQPRRVIDDDGHVITTPITDYQYLMNNDINDSLLAMIKPRADKNTIILAVLAGLGVAVVGYLIMTVVM